MDESLKCGSIDQSHKALKAPAHILQYAIQNSNVNISVLLFWIWYCEYGTEGFEELAYW